MDVKTTIAHFRSQIAWWKIVDKVNIDSWKMYWERKGKEPKTCQEIIKEIKSRI